MFSKKIIEVPVDFSKSSLNALEYAIEFANRAEADLRLIYVKKHKDYEPDFMLEKYVLEGVKNLNELFERLIEKYKDKFKGDFDYKIREGNISEEVTNQAKYDDAFLIIMGTHGISGFQEMWIGSNAYRVVSTAPCPVLTVRPQFKFDGIKKIILPLDVTETTRQKVGITAYIASLFDAEVEVLGVRETDLPKVIETINKSIDWTCNVLEKKGIKYTKDFIKCDNITDCTIKYAQEHGGSLISIMTEQPTNFWDVILGKYAQQMVNHSPIPVLSVRPKSPLYSYNGIFSWF